MSTQRSATAHHSPLWTITIMAFARGAVTPLG